MKKRKLSQLLSTVSILVIISTFSILLVSQKVYADGGEGNFKDRAHINITKIEITDERHLSPDGKKVGLAKVNEWLSEQFKGEYFDADISDDTNEFERETCADSDKHHGKLDAVSTEGVDKGEMFFSSEEVWIMNKDPQYNMQCFKPLNPYYRIKITVNPANNDFWFIWKDDKTLVRVDGNDGDYVYDNGSKRYIRSGGGDECPSGLKPYVELKEELKETTRATYESCDRIGKRDVIVKKASATNPLPGQNTGPGSPGGEPEPTCEQNNPGGFSWLFCGLLDVVDDTVSTIIDQAYNLLNLNPQLYDTSQDGGRKLQQVWAYFRNISSLLLIVVGLVMIIGQAIGKD